jgi:ketosteroid isomerase-like protein
MRPHTALPRLALALAISALPAAAQQSMVRPASNVPAASASDRMIADEIVRIVRAQWQAETAKDLAAATKNIAADYTEFNGDYATRLEGKEIAVKLEDAGFKDSGKQLVGDMINPLVQVYGNTAILTYNFVGVTQDKDGKTVPTRAKSTRVYVRQGGGEWMLVHANFAPDPLPKP